jgi:hypothetical protein
LCLPVIGAALLACLLPSSCRSPATAPDKGTRAPGTLLLTGAGAGRGTLRPVTGDTTCAEPNLVIVTHGWFEKHAWPADMALAIAGRTDPQQWCCGWYDWRRAARCIRPWEAAKIARYEAGPHLGREILRLSRQYRHVHLIGHSAGAWVVNEAANMIACQTEAEIHLTFLDAYVPDFWTEQDLGRPAESSQRIWAEQYFTRDFLLHFSDTGLTHAHNVDLTKAAPWPWFDSHLFLIDSHQFPILWYRATVTGRYEHSWRLGGKSPRCQAEGIEYGFARSRESGWPPWARSLALPAGPDTIQIRPTRPPSPPR